MLILKQEITFNLRFPILMSAKIKLRSESRTGVDGQKRTFENTFEELMYRSNRSFNMPPPPPPPANTPGI